MAVDVEHQVPKDGYGQHYSTTCWYSSYRMLYAWKKADESKIKPRLKNAGLNLKELGKRGLLIPEYKQAASLVGYGWSGEWIRDQSTGILVHILKQYGPLWIAMDWRGNKAAGHAVVIVGYKSKDDVFKIHNPYNRFSPGTVEVEWLKPKAVKDWVQNARFAVQAWK